MVGWPERPVLVAPGSFKGTFRAAAVAGAIGSGLERAGLVPPDICVTADGGAGTLESLLLALGGETAGSGPGAFGLVEGGGTAVLEPLPEETTYGTGELICAAVDAGAAVVLLAAAGSATTDGGTGALAAIEQHGGLRGARLVVLTERRVPAGSLGDALRAIPGTVLEPGVPWVLDALGFDARMRTARAVVTGEGRLDSHSLEGRLVGEIGTRTRQAGVPLHAIVGSEALDRFGKRIIDLQVVLEASDLEQIQAAGEAVGTALADGSA